MEHLKGNILNLRPLEPEDLDLLYLWENDPGNWQVSQTVSPFSKTVLKKYLEQAHLDLYQIKQLRLVIQLKTENRAIGFIDLFDFDPFHQRAGIGILIGDKSDRKKGFASEALELLLDYCFNILVLNQVYCNILESNKSSRKLFENAGFYQAGKRKSWVRTNSGWLDEFFLQLLRKDYLSN